MGLIRLLAHWNKLRLYNKVVRHIILLFLFLNFVYCCKSQRLFIDTTHKVNNNFHYKPKVKIQNLLYVKYHGAFSIAMNVNVNRKDFKYQNLDDNLSAGMQYDFKTKFYISKRVRLIIREQVTVVKYISSIGISIKLNK